MSLKTTQTGHQAFPKQRCRLAKNIWPADANTPRSHQFTKLLLQTSTCSLLAHFSKKHSEAAALSEKKRGSSCSTGWAQGKRGSERVEGIVSGPGHVTCFYWPFASQTLTPCWLQLRVVSLFLGGLWGSLVLAWCWKCWWLTDLLGVGPPWMWGPIGRSRLNHPRVGSAPIYTIETSLPFLPPFPTIASNILLFDCLSGNS